MFQDRVDAGRQLAKRLACYANRKDIMVLGIPRGGVPVAFEVAQALHAPLDILLVRKLGAPDEPELAIGAIASGGVRILDRHLIASLGITQQQIAEIIAAQELELQRRELLYRGVRPDISVRGKTAILVDDGIATGSSMLAAISALRSLQPRRIIVAVPVAPAQSDQQIAGVANEFVCVDRPAFFRSVGQFYQNFSPTEDSDVSQLLEHAARIQPPALKPESRGAA